MNLSHNPNKQSGRKNSYQHTAPRHMVTLNMTIWSGVFMRLPRVTATEMTTELGCWNILPGLDSLSGFSDSICRHKSRRSTKYIAEQLVIFASNQLKELVNRELTSSTLAIKRWRPYLGLANRKITSSPRWTFAFDKPDQKSWRWPESCQEFRIADWGQNLKQFKTSGGYGRSRVISRVGIADKPCSDVGQFLLMLMTNILFLYYHLGVFENPLSPLRIWPSRPLVKPFTILAAIFCNPDLTQTLLELSSATQMGPRPILLTWYPTKLCPRRERELTEEK